MVTRKEFEALKKSLADAEERIKALETVVALGRRPPMPDMKGCTFCSKYRGWGGHLEKHERHCRKNPNRIPHPREGVKWPAPPPFTFGSTEY
jgi:hypothetical protein